jgi:hypothetical protein
MVLIEPDCPRNVIQATAFEHDKRGGAARAMVVYTLPEWKLAFPSTGGSIRCPTFVPAGQMGHSRRRGTIRRCGSSGLRCWGILKQGCIIKAGTLQKRFSFIGF